MDKKGVLILECLLACGILTSCGFTQAELDKEATEIAADIFATQAAQAPTQTAAAPTQTPATTSTPSPFPSPMPPTATPFPVTGERIAFVSFLDGDPEVYLMKPDGSLQTKLTDLNQRFIIELIWSPDGEQLAFISERHGEWKIYVMNYDGTALTQLIKTGDDIRSLAWSPDGAKLAFEMAGVGRWQDIYVISANDGTGLKNLTDANYDDMYPAWSPESDFIAFASGRNPSFDFPTFEIYIMGTDGSNQTSMIDNPYIANDVSPVWSSDGTRLAFVSDRTRDNELYVIDFIANGYMRISEVQANRASPIQHTWSPDGELIAFAAKVDFQYEIFVIKPDGSGELVRLTHDPEDDTDPAWSPDGEQIVFVSRRDGDQEIYIMNADGSDQRKLTDSLAGSYYPTWSP